MLYDLQRDNKLILTISIILSDNQNRKRVADESVHLISAKRLDRCAKGPYSVFLLMTM